MKKFKYRLKALLKVKEQIEKDRQKEHALAIQKVIDQNNELSRISDVKDVTTDNQRKRLTGKLSVAELLVFGRYLMKLKRETMAGKELLTALQRGEQGKREILQEASRQRKIQEKLKEKQQAKFNREVELLETKENDEIAITNFRRLASKDGQAVEKPA